MDLPPPPGFSSHRSSPSSSSQPCLDLNLALCPLVAPKLEPLYEEEEEEERTNGHGISSQPIPNLDDFKRKQATGGCFDGGDENESPSPLCQLPPTSEEDRDLLSRFYDLDHFFTNANTTTMAACASGSDESKSEWAIVPAPNDIPGTLASLVVPPNMKRNHTPRSAEMVRVSNLNDEEKIYFRNLVRRRRMMYDSLRVLLLVDGERVGSKSRTSANLMPATGMTSRGLSLNRDKRVIGSIPGINIGDIFFFRVELCVLGLHGQTQAGIDSVAASQSPNGEPIATSIVVSGGYEDDEDTGNVIIYTGQGGKMRSNFKHSVDQKLTSGNLALERSLNYGIEIRVIRGFKFAGSPSGKIYVYDGLYRVVKYWMDVGKSGFSVYKYKLVRIVGQEEMGSCVLKHAQHIKEQLMKGVMPFGYMKLDISNGRENFPIPIFNNVDRDPYPLYFEYLPHPVYPKSILSNSPIHGCMCVSNCSENCSCAEKNGGEFPYDNSGILLKGKPLIYECGKSCRCPLSCRNRVSQKGLRSRLEVFRSPDTGWGVRSLDLIRAGAFVCEYTGVVVTQQQSELVSMNGGSLIHPSQFPNRWYEWGDLTEVLPNYPRSMFPPLPRVNFSMDVSQRRNVACYLSHSGNSPNVFLQFCLYDHGDVSYPHLMIFAMENIPPLKDLSIDYGVGDTCLTDGAGIMTTTNLPPS
ncbi:Histone-lysine N-methyltransferase [Zostera marina]|uniref:Histone-lysine N-methyltransferase n=1 Tax=Zostera marina TaxID=29655 RepID=A0A0K9P7F6_ZOSMR|nr:Histone-lysine N-methyltransferase [Zostera marina]